MGKLLNLFNNLSPSGTKLTVEMRAGFTTFLMMAYILFVNPSILAVAMPGIDRPQLIAATALSENQGPDTGRTPLLKRAYKFLGHFLKVPDSRILWMPWAVARGIRLCRSQGIDVILATGPSFTNFLIGAWIKVFTRRPLLLDVRDAWTADPTRAFERNYLGRLDERCERFALNRADRVITTNPFVTRDFAERYPGKPATAFDTIYNGFDQEDFSFSVQSPAKADDRPFTIVHTGRLYAERTPKFFLQTLGHALQENVPIGQERDQATLDDNILPDDRLLDFATNFFGPQFSVLHGFSSLT